MTFSILNRLAMRSMAAHKKSYLPFILAVSLMFSLLYIMISLTQNDYVETRHEDLVMVVNFGAFLTSILASVLTVYASRFVQNDQTKEYGLYSVLGLGKGHIQWITFLQTLLSAIISFVLANVLGYLMGNFTFVALNRLMKDTGADFMDYPFNLEFSFYLLLVMTFVFFIILFLNAWQIIRLKPLDLMKASQVGQKKVKSRWFLALLGFICVGIGYYYALTTDNVIASLSLILVVVLLIVIGTYLLFLSFTVLVLKFLKSRKGLYYQPAAFLSISGMIHRMASNAVSLATISILCSGAILVLGSSVTLYGHMENMVDQVMPSDYSLQMVTNPSLDSSDDFDSFSDLQTCIEEDERFSNVKSRLTVESPGYLKGNDLLPLPEPNNPQLTGGKPVFLVAEALDSFESFSDSDIELSENEVILSSNLLDLSEMETIDLGDRTFQVKAVEVENLALANMGVESLAIVFSNEDLIQEFREEFVVVYNGEVLNNPPQPYIYFDYEGDPEVLPKLVEEWNEDSVAYMRLESREESQKSIYELNGGLLFLGIVVSLVLLIGTLVMLYFKQVSEGQQDKNNYDIMHKVGLDDRLIRKNIRIQVLWLFFLPLLVAVVHNFISSQIMFRLFGLFGVSDFHFIVINFGIAALFFILIYWLFFLITSRAYYQSVGQFKEGD